MTLKLFTISLVIFVVLASGKGTFGDENVKNVDYYEGKYTSYCCLLREDKWNVKKVVLKYDRKVNLNKTTLHHNYISSCL